MPGTDNASCSGDEQRWSALMVSAQARDETDYRLLLEEVSRVVTRSLVARFGVCDFVDDCVQDSLIAVHQARHTFDPRRPLPAAHREALTLTKILGLSTAEAAARLAISEGALKVRVHRAVNRLRQLLDTEGL